MEQRYADLGKIFANADTAAKLMSLSAEEAKVFLKEQYNLDFTEEELLDVAKGMKKALSDDDSGELCESDLEEVAGGGKGSGAYNAGYYIGKTVKVAGTVIGIIGAAVAMGW